MELKNFKYNSRLRELLVNYSLINYEENARIDDEYLIMEYYLLERNNQLHLLFEAENLNNYLNDADNYNG